MKTSLTKIVKQMEILQENEQGQLKGGFASISSLSHDGVSLLGISDALENIGFKTIGGKLTLEQLINDAPLPCVIYWEQNHFVVLYKIKKKKYV